jgi:membrane fusion protein (multidrug efflux system)
MVATARINLGYTRIVAPIEGRIGRSSFTEGAIVTAYQPEALATIQQLDPIYVDVPQSTTEMTRLRRHMEQGRLRIKEDEINRVKLVLVEDNSIYPLEGTLQFHDVTVDPTTGSVILRMVFPNPKHELLPGMYVRALVREGINDQAILAPQEGVARNPKGESYALIVDGQDKVQQRILALDRAVSNQWLIASGLQAGDRVIVEGLQRVKPGETARVVSPAN